jgi:hypothetical protein
MSPTLRIILLFLLVFSTFNLGAYSAQFSGSTSAWMSAILSVVVLLSCLSVLIYELRKSNN